VAARETAQRTTPRAPWPCAGRAFRAAVFAGVLVAPAVASLAQPDMAPPLPTYHGRVVDSIDLPTPCPVGLAIGAPPLIYYTDYDTKELIRFDVRSRRIVGRAPYPDDRPAEIALVDGWLYGVGEVSHSLYRFSPQTGEVLARCALPLGRPFGLEYAEGRLWISDVCEPWIVAVDPANGAELGRIPAPQRGLSGLAWDGRFLW